MNLNLSDADFAFIENITGGKGIRQLNAVESVVELISDLMIEVGVGEDGSLNSVGVKLDSLIDKVLGK